MSGRNAGVCRLATDTIGRPPTLLPPRGPNRSAMSDTISALTEALADRYRVERELGQGGMATVRFPAWRA